MAAYSKYLALEASSDRKHEFLDGQIYATATSAPEHAALAAAVIGLLSPQLRGSNCRAYDASLRVRTPSGLSTYPDVTVIRGPNERHEGDVQAVTNPTLIIEVVRRGDKFTHYKTLPSLRQYVLVSHRERSVEVWTRDEDAWRSAVLHEGETAQLSIGARLEVRELYGAASEPAP